jgi:hypothetical protein
MDNKDSTNALLAGWFKEAERALDMAVDNFYDESAWGHSAVNVDLNDNSEDPPFKHNVPSAPHCLSGNKRALPLLWTEQQQPPLKTTSTTIDLAAKNAKSPNTFTYLGFTYTHQNINKTNFLYYCNHHCSSKCKSAKLRLPFVGGKADINQPKVVGSHTRTCCIRNGVPTEGEGSYEWEGKASLKDNNEYGNKENAHPNKAAPLYIDVKEDMRKKIQVLACNNLTWSLAMCFDACWKEMDASFPQGWSGLQKHQAHELVRKACCAQGLGNTVSTVENTPAYSQMKDTKHPFLQFSGTWPHPEKPEEQMRLMVFGNPTLIPFLKTQGQILSYFLLPFSIFFH